MNKLLYIYNNNTMLYIYIFIFILYIDIIYLIIYYNIYLNIFFIFVCIFCIFYAQRFNLISKYKDTDFNPQKETDPPGIMSPFQDESHLRYSITQLQQMSGTTTQQQTSLTSPAGQVYTFSVSFVLMCLLIIDPVQQGTSSGRCCT